MIAFHVDPSVVRRILPPSPTATPFDAVEKAMDVNPVFVGVVTADHDVPPFVVLRMFCPFTSHPLLTSTKYNESADSPAICVKVDPESVVFPRYDVPPRNPVVLDCQKMMLRSVLIPTDLAVHVDPPFVETRIVPPCPTAQTSVALLATIKVRTLLVLTLSAVKETPSLLDFKILLSATIHTSVAKLMLTKRTRKAKLILLLLKAKKKRTTKKNTHTTGN